VDNQCLRDLKEFDSVEKDMHYASQNNFTRMMVCLISDIKPRMLAVKRFV